MSSLLVVGIALILIIFVRYRRRNHSSISNIRGPASTSFLLGHLTEFHYNGTGETEIQWQNEFGNVVRFKAPLGEDRLSITDPTAIEHIFHYGGYRYMRPPERREQMKILTGEGLVWVEGDQHKRHKRIMLPAFGTAEARTFWPIFSGHVGKVTTIWQDMLASSKEGALDLNVASWISRAMLDVIGEAAFDYHIGALEHGHESELGRVWQSFILDSFNVHSPVALFMQNFLGYIPLEFFYHASKFLPGLAFKKVREAEEVSTRIARELLVNKSEDIIQGQSHRDLMTLLLKANGSENPKTQLSDDEICAEMRTILLAGHETTANTLGFSILELAKSPKMQNTLRAEIRAKAKELAAKGQFGFLPTDMEEMPYLQAFTKESMRYHPVTPVLHRQALEDDMVPLSKPVTTISGEEINQVFIPKGTKIAASVTAYNRNKGVWGPDADEFNPDRWLNRQKPAVSIGPFEGLLTFGGGRRACIGFRFATVEFQAFLVEFINNFEFLLNDRSGLVRRQESGGVMVPIVEGEVKVGVQLPMRVRRAP
ncbi:hypothetical protein ONZ45_g6795 [Pleurotus djamor]|nr:hypothetical protein ONZ45_g6795 [Pleurotus djamor]